MAEKKCIIVGSGKGLPRTIAINEDDFVVAADGGLFYLREMGIQPHLILGDFDSLGYIPDENNLIVHPVEKDDTDMMLAVKEGLKRGYQRFYLFGGQGGRLDHTIANIQILNYITSIGCEGFLAGDDFQITVLRNAKLVLKKEVFLWSGMGLGPTVSVFSIGSEAKGVTIQGAKYEAEDITLTDTYPLGVSNSFEGKDIHISVKDGSILVMWQGQLTGEE